MTGIMTLCYPLSNISDVIRTALGVLILVRKQQQQGLINKPLAFPRIFRRYMIFNRNRLFGVLIFRQQRCSAAARGLIDKPLAFPRRIGTGALTLLRSILDSDLPGQAPAQLPRPRVGLCCLRQHSPTFVNRKRKTFLPFSS
jgi:hypothetical protein